MFIEHVLTYAVGFLGLTLLAAMLARVTRIPEAVLLVGIGAIAAHGLTLGLGLDTGLRADNFAELIFYVFLPILVFEAAYRLPLEGLRTELPTVLLLSILGMLISTLVSAWLMFVGIDHAAGFPFIAALLAGALMSATDPATVVDQLRRIGALERLALRLEGESLFNDATAIVAFSLVLELALMPEQGIDGLGALRDFILVFIGGGLIGVVAGSLGLCLVRLNPSVEARGVIGLLVAYGSFLVAEVALELSGVMASLAAGLMLANIAHHRQPEERGRIDFLLAFLSMLAGGFVFLLMGFTLTLSMFTERWLAMLIAILAVMVARAASVFLTLAPLNLLQWLRRGPMTSATDQAVLAWGGLRGAVTLALALSLPTELDYWWTIQSMAFGVVLFSLLVQGLTLPLLARALPRGQGNGLA